MVSLAMKGKKPRELNWSSLAGTWGLLYYQSMYVHVCVRTTDKSWHRLSMWQHTLGACIKHSHGMEGKHEATTRRWQNGRKGIAMHCTEMNEVRSAWGMVVKWKEKHRGQHSCHRLSDKIRKKRKMTKFIRTILGILSHKNAQPYQSWHAKQMTAAGRARLKELWNKCPWAVCYPGNISWGCISNPYLLKGVLNEKHTNADFQVAIEVNNV